MTAAVRAPYHQFNFNLASTTKYFPIHRHWCVFFSFNEISLLGECAVVQLLSNAIINKIVTHFSWPLTMIPTREHKASASSMEWVVRIAPRFPWTFLLMVFLIRGSETKERVKYLVHMKKQFTRLDGNETRSQIRKVFSGAKTPKGSSRNTEVFARNQQNSSRE